MPTRKPSTAEGRKLRNKVNSKDVKLRKNKIVEKTSTGKKKTIQRAGKPVKTVEVKKTVKRSGGKGNVAKGAKIGGRIGAAVGGAVGGSIGYGVAKMGDNKAGYKTLATAGTGGMGSGIGYILGNVTGQAIAKRTSRKTTKTRTVNGVNKTAQRSKAKAQTKTMRAKKRGSKR